MVAEGPHHTAREKTMPAVASGARSPRSPAVGLNVALWIVQLLLSLTLAGGAIWKVGMPTQELAKNMPWMGEVSPAFLYTTALFDLLGGLGLILPSATRIRPGLTPIAALACIALMVAAIIFHVARGEAADTPFNFLLIALLVFVYWGRKTKVPIQERA